MDSFQETSDSLDQPVIYCSEAVFEKVLRMQVLWMAKAHVPVIASSPAAMVRARTGMFVLRC